MTHLTEGAVVAVRDQGPLDAASGAHLDDCERCRELVEDAGERARFVQVALTSLDDRVDPRAAKAVVRARLDASAGRPRSRWRGWPLGRAAVLLLVAAGAASALPGSPVRSWWASRTASPAPGSTGPGAAPQTALVSGITVEPADGGVVVAVHRAEPGTPIELVWVEATAARITAPAGSSFTYERGSARVDVVPGVLRVELPRGTELARLEVDGVTYAERLGSETDIAGPVTERADGRVLFRVPGA